MKTHHTSTRPLKDKKNIKEWMESVQWMGLTILNKEQGLEADSKGMVEFKALYMEAGQLETIHEKSLFRKERGMWYYVSGQHF